MVYKNFIYRFISSILFLSIYSIIVIYDISLIYYLIFLIYFVIFLEVIINFKKFKLLIIGYLVLSLSFFLNLNYDYNNIILFNLLIIIIISFDTFSYIFGNLIGKTNFLKISPNKTLEGTIFGFILSIVSSLLYSLYFSINVNINLILFIILIILSAFIGDILESYFKRMNNLKNSSNWVPGHGGFFDRFDSFIFSIIFYSILNNYIS